MGLVILGLAFVVAEIVPPPTFGVLFVCSVASFLGGIWIAFNVGTAFGLSLILAVVVGVPLVAVLTFKVLPRTRMGKRMIPEGPRPEDVAGTGADPELKKLLGKSGRTLSMCRPSGTAEFDGESYNVVTKGLPILPDRPVRVVAVEGNRVVVRESE